MATYHESAQLLDSFAQHMIREGAYRVMDFSVGDIRMWRFMNQQLFTLVRVQDAGPNSLATIDIAGGGACEMRPSEELFHYLATPDESFQYGARFASTRGNGSVLSGARLALPLAIINIQDPECTRFVVSMVENLGIYARRTAEYLRSAHGGRLLAGEDEDDAANLFAAATGH